MTIDPFLAGLVTALSVFCGFAAYLQAVRDSRLARGVVNALADLAAACSAGWGMLFCGLWQEWPEPLVCLCVIIAASNSSFCHSFMRRALFVRQ